MLKVLKNLKYSAISVIMIVLLLCLQAYTDLSLPNYTSNIVNTGIQAGGIEKVSPEAIRKNMMDLVLIFTQDDDKIIESYNLISKNQLSQDDYDKYVSEYPILENEDIYIIKEISKEELEELDNIIAKPLLIATSVEDEVVSSQIKEKIIENMPEEQKAVLNNMSLNMILQQMPEEQIDSMMENFGGIINELSDSMLLQAATSATKTEYETIGMDTGKIQNRYIIKTGFQMLGIAFVSMAAAITIMLLSSRVAARLGKTLREKTFKKVISFSTKEFREFSTASLITRSTNDIQQIQGLIQIMFRVLIYAPIMGIGGLILVITKSNLSMAWIIALAVFTIFVLVIILFIVAMPKFKILQTLVDKLNKVSREILTGLSVIRAFNKEKVEEERFEKANQNLMKTNIFVNTAMSIMMPTMMFVMNSIMLLIIWFGGKNIDSGVMQVGDMMAFIQYTMQIIMSFLMISAISIMLPRASVSANRINDILECEQSIKDPENPKELDKNKKGLIEFKNVSFRYPDADTEILENITFTAKPGETTAIIGSTGSGKTTIVNLIPRFYDVTSGELLVDGVNVKEVKQKDLRNLIGFVPQKGMLFSGTIETNIKYSNPNMADEQMIEAAEIAQAAEFINDKEERYNQEIAQAGNNVSGGQKQRLSIARAIAKDPEIFIFDDSFSALDFKTDSNLRAALAEKTQNKTVIIVAQRISTILNADQIIVLDEGKIVGIGTHQELMKNNETYKQIALSQLSEEELG